MKQRVYNILMLLLIGGLYGLYYMDYQEEHKEPDKVDVLRLEQPEFLLSEAPDDYLMEALEYYNVNIRIFYMLRLSLRQVIFSLRSAKSTITYLDSIVVTRGIIISLTIGVRVWLPISITYNTDTNPRMITINF